MKTLQIDEKNARKLFKGADPAFKQTLIDTFGEPFFSEKITDRVKTFEDACEVLGINPSDVSIQSTGMSKDLKSIQAYSKLIIIARALNEGWEPNWDNSNEYKYYSWFKMSGLGFSYRDFVFSFSGTRVGSRLCFKTSDLATYAGKQFESIYKDYLTI